MDDPLAPLPAAEFDRAAAARLLRRAGFSGPPAEIERVLALGVDGAVAWMLAPREPLDPPLPAEPLRLTATAELMRMPPALRQQVRDRYRVADFAQIARLQAAWIARMMGARHPLRERMTLLWHGVLTSAHREVESSAMMAAQHALLHRSALGRYGELLHAVARDPAMLVYLGNAENRAVQPNENFARELLELFVLGEGHYAETDVREAARAFAGWTLDDAGAFAVREDWCDHGAKRVLGTVGPLDGDAVIELAWRHPQAALRLAHQLVHAFVSAAPDPRLVVALARVLHDGELDVGKALDRLLRSAAFYRAPPRIVPPVVWLVSRAREKLARPPEIAPLLACLAERLGQAPFDPPNVAGWPSDTAWITTASYLARVEAAGLLAGDRLRLAAWADQRAAERDQERARYEAERALDRATMSGSRLERTLDGVASDLAVSDARAEPAIAACRGLTPPAVAELLGAGEPEELAERLATRLGLDPAWVSAARRRLGDRVGWDDLAAILLGAPEAQLA